MDVPWHIGIYTFFFLSLYTYYVPIKSALRSKFDLRTFLIGLLTILLASSVYLNVRNKHSPGVILRVSKVIDGDTIVLTDNRRVRLLGIDAPEITDCLGPQAQKALEKDLLNKTVTLDEVKMDSFQRTLASVYIDRKYMNAVPVELGLARLDYSKTIHSEELKKANQKARKEKSGIYSSRCVSRDPTTPTCVIKGNIDPASGKKFYHVPGCPHYSEISLDTAFGEGWFCTEKEAQEKGFIKASGCN